MAGRANNPNDDDGAPAAAAPAPSVLKMAFAGGVAVFLAMLGAQVTAPILTQMISGSGEPAAATSDESADAEAGSAVDPRSLPPPIYLPLDPPLVVSFADGAGRTRFMQLSLQAMGRDQKALDGVKTHAPAIRNAFLFLISKRSIDELGTIEGKEKLRADMLAEAQSIMRANTGNDALEELYFTSLVIQ